MRARHIAICAFFTSLSCSAQYSADLRVVAVAGEPASNALPGLSNGGFRLSHEERSQIDDGGNIVYWLGLSGPGIHQYNGVCLMHLPEGQDAREGEASVILRSGTQAPGAPFGSQFHEVRRMALSAEGRLALNVYRRGAAGQSTINGYANYVWSSSDMHTLAHSAGDIPGEPTPSHYLYLDHPHASSDGDSAAWSSVIQETDADLIQLYSNNQYTTLARTGMQIPGELPGVVYEEICSVAYSSGDKAYVLSSISGTGVDSSNNYGVWFTDGVNSSKLFQKGDPAPGFPVDLECDYAQFIPSGDGYHAIKLYFTGPGTSDYNDDALYILEEGKAPALVVRDGQGVPGYKSGAYFTTVSYAQVNNFAEAMFVVTTYGSSLPQTGTGLWKATNPNDITPVLAPGDAAPGHEKDVFIFRIMQFDMNDSGDFAVAATIQGPGIDHANNKQIYLGTRDGRFYRAVQTGQTINTSKAGEPEELRQVDEFSFEVLDSFWSSAQYSQFNNNGDLALNVRFTDGSTAVIVVSLPDPCLPDINNDGTLSPTDFTAWINAFNNNLPECDQNGDGACTPTDFTAWIANFNAGC